MGLLSATAHGEIEVPSLPDDVVDRIARRVRDDRLFGIGSRQQFAIDPHGESAGVLSARRPIDVPARRDSGGYRDAPRGARTVFLSRKKGDVDAIRLAIDGPHVRWEADFPRARRIGLIDGALLGVFFGAMATPLLPLAPGFAVGMMVFGLATFFLMTLIAVKATAQRVSMQLEKMLREEALEAGNESRLRAELGGGTAAERARAILAVLDARHVALTEAERARVLAVADEVTANDWLARAATATRADDVFARVRVAPDDLGEAADEEVAVEPGRLTK